MNKNLISVVMIGATGAVGTQTLKVLLKKTEDINQITTLGRREVANISEDFVEQKIVNIFQPETYINFLQNHEVAVCTLGVGQPSKVSKKDFIKIDKTAVLDFAKACKKSGVRHFQLLSSVAVDSKSASFFLRTKGELVDELINLNFDRLSIFQPSMILTPKNRYGIAQALTLFFWPMLNPFLFGRLKKYRGVKVENLGKAFANNIFSKKEGVEFLTWKNFRELPE